jgi:hypothetical protein
MCELKKRFSPKRLPGSFKYTPGPLELLFAKCLKTEGRQSGGKGLADIGRFPAFTVNRNGSLQILCQPRTIAANGLQSFSPDDGICTMMAACPHLIFAGQWNQMKPFTRSVL